MIVIYVISNFTEAYALDFAICHLIFSLFPYILIIECHSIRAHAMQWDNGSTLIDR